MKFVFLPEKCHSAIKLLIVAVGLALGTTQAAERIEVVETIHQIGVDCGIHAAKNAYAFYAKNPAILKDTWKFKPYRYYDLPDNTKITFLDPDEVKQVLRQYDVPQRAFTLIDSTLPLHHLRTGLQSVAAIRWEAMTNIHEAFNRLEKHRDRHIFLLNTGAYKTDAQGRLLGKDNRPLAPGTPREEETELIGGHWFTVHVYNENGTLHYQVADSLSGYQREAVLDLQWMLERLAPRDKAFVRHIEFEHIVETAHHRLTDAGVSGTNAAKERDSLRELTNVINTATGAGILGHNAFIERYKKRLDGCFAVLKKSTIANHAQQARTLESRFYQVMPKQPIIAGHAQQAQALESHTKQNFFVRFLKATHQTIASLLVATSNKFRGFGAFFARPKATPIVAPPIIDPRDTDIEEALKQSQQESRIQPDTSGDAALAQRLQLEIKKKLEQEASDAALARRLAQNRTIERN